MFGLFLVASLLILLQEVLMARAPRKYYPRPGFVHRHGVAAVSIRETVLHKHLMLTTLRMKQERLGIA